MTMALRAATVGTAVAVATAPLFTALYVDSIGGDANPALTTALAYLLLPQILFYGLFALSRRDPQHRRTFRRAGLGAGAEQPRRHRARSSCSRACRGR